MNTSKYIIPLLLLLSPALHAVNDSLFSPGLRIGADLSGFARNYFEPETMAWEVSTEMEWRRNWIAVLEGGGLHVAVKKTSHSYMAKGYFFRAGIDYNLIDRPDMENVGMVYALTRYGFGRLRHEASNILIYNDYWGDYESSIAPETGFAHWFEIGGGLKTRLAGNFFIGWSVRARFLLHLTDTQGMEPYYISGFGKNEGKPSVMVHYYLYYKF